MLNKIFFCCFLVLLIGCPVVRVSADSKPFDDKKNIGAQQGAYTSDKNSLQSQSLGYESEKYSGVSKANEPHFNRDAFAYAFIKDIKKAEVIDHFSENYPMGLNENQFNSHRSPFKIGTYSGADSYEEMNRYYEVDGYNFYDRFQDGIKTELGEDVYEKAVWTYVEIKGLDNWINSTIAQYGFGDGSLLGKQKDVIVGVDGLLNVMAIFQKGDNAHLYTEGREGREGSELWKSVVEGDKVFPIGSHQDGLISAQVMDSKFAAIFEYLTFINIIYSFSIIFFVVMVAKAFTFLVRQQ